jgi:hypothetical protein
MSAPYTSTRSPPPLIHPRPSHISQPPPEPRSSTSMDASRLSGDSYSRFSSPPPVESAQGQGQAHGAYAFGGQGGTFSMMGDGTAPPQQQQQFMGAASSRTGPYAPQTQGGEYMNPMGMNVGGGQTGGFNAFGAAGQWPMGMNDATAQMGMQFGKSAVAAGQDYVEKNVSPPFHALSALLTLTLPQFSRYLPLPLLKTSFSVTNSYVLHKLRLVLFPWRHRPWSRLPIRSNRIPAGQDGVAGAVGADGWMPPRDDINAPDLYIPSESFPALFPVSSVLTRLQSDGPCHLRSPLGSRIRSAEALPSRSSGIHVQ